MSWPAILTLAACVYATKAVGPLLLGTRRPPPRLDALLAVVAVPMFGALILIQTVTSGHRFVADARLPAVLAAIVAVRLRAPFLVVVLLAAGTCALLRAVG